MKTSLFRSPQCFTRSALLKNLNAKPSSRKPKTIFTEVSQPPLFGKALSRLGNNANKPKGNARANPNPPIPAVSCMAPPSALNDPASREPKIGPVQEKETIAKVSAIKNMPITFPEPALLSAEFPKLLGSVIS